MKKFLFCIALASTLQIGVHAQSIVDAEDGRNFNDFYQPGLVAEKQAIPYPFVRESDVVWKHVVWRKIDMNEAFNQYMYFPQEVDGNTQNRINIVNLIMQAAERGDIEVYESDDLLVPMDPEKAKEKMASKTLSTKFGEEDEYGERETFEVEETVPFEAEGVHMLHMKEYWYIDKQDTRQKVRITALCFEFMRTNIQAGAQEDVADNSFWIPMDDMRVRNVFVKANAYDENNDVGERSYDDIFIQRYFDSYIVRESNRWNRSILDYLTGEDAIYESRNIEDKIFNAESDMWEY